MGYRSNYFENYAERQRRTLEREHRTERRAPRTDSPKVLRIARHPSGGWTVSLERGASYGAMTALGLHWSACVLLNGRTPATDWLVPAGACDERGKIRDPRLAAFLRDNYAPVPTPSTIRTTRRTSR